MISCVDTRYVCYTCYICYTRETDIGGFIGTTFCNHCTRVN
jgi:hypothetical protein